MKKLDAVTVSMHVDEYRFFITRIAELEAKSASLESVLAKERASFDMLVMNVKTADKARLAERAESDARIARLEAHVKRYRAQKWWPGIIGGGGITRHGDVEGVIGLGWKIDLF